MFRMFCRKGFTQNRVSTSELGGGEAGGCSGLAVDVEERLSLGAIQGRALPEVPERYSTLSIGLKAMCHVYHQPGEFSVQDVDGYLKAKPMQIPPKSINRKKNVKNEHIYMNRECGECSEQYQVSDICDDVEDGENVTVSPVELGVVLQECENYEISQGGVDIDCEVESVVEEQYSEMR